MVAAIVEVMVGKAAVAQDNLEAPDRQAVMAVEVLLIYIAMLAALLSAETCQERMAMAVALVGVLVTQVRGHLRVVLLTAALLCVAAWVVEHYRDQVVAMAVLRETRVVVLVVAVGALQGVALARVLAVQPLQAHLLH